VLLFFKHFSLGNHFTVRKKNNPVGHVVGRSVDSIQNRVSFAPLLHHNYQHTFNIWCLGTIFFQEKRQLQALKTFNPQTDAL
jgi:hypothetical protein